MGGIRGAVFYFSDMVCKTSMCIIVLHYNYLGRPSLALDRLGHLVAARVRYSLLSWTLNGQVCDELHVTFPCSS